MLRKSRSSSLKSAVRPVLEALESRQLMSATLTLVNPDAIAGTSRIVFNKVQNPDTTYPNATLVQQTVNITDTGTTPLVISSITLDGPWSFVNAPTGGYSNVTVNPGTPLPITLLFTQSTLPSHSYNETDYTNNTNGGAAITGAMTITSNDATTPNKVVTLAGYWQSQSNNNTEPSLQTLVNLIYGYQVNINATPIPDLTQSSTPVYYGSEVASSYWEAADPTQRVHLQEIGEWHTEGNPATTYWYNSQTTSTNLFTTPRNAGQTLLPSLNSSNLAISNFNPNGAFGIRVDNEYSTDSVNVALGNGGGGGHHFRFFPLVDENGNTVPNTYIVAMDYGLLQDENYDFQDNVFLLSNVRPTGTPATPTNLAATSGSTPVLTWTAVNYTPVSYDVYRSTSATGTYSLLTTTPITTTTYTDSTAPNGTLYYQVTAVDATQNPVASSAPATVQTTGGTAPTAPIGQPYTAADYNNLAVTFNPLVGVVDTSGTVIPSSVTVTAPSAGGTATVAASGLITYTPLAGFTGTETFTYTVTDSNSLTSAPAQITFTDSAPVVTSPVVNNYFTTTLAGAAVTIPILSVDDPVTTFNTSSIVITSTSTHGTPVINSDGTVTYTPNATFIGGDTFTYTVADSNGQTSAPAIVDINVGAEISSAKGADRTLVYPGTGGNLVTVTLNSGVADIYFDGNGTVVSTTKNKVVINGNSLRIRDLALSGTKVSSTLSITAAHNTAVNLGAVSDSSPLGTLSARTATLSAASGNIAAADVLHSASLSTASVISPAATSDGTQEPAAGTISLSGVRSIALAGAATGTFNLGGTGVTGTSVVIAGPVTDTNLTSAVPLTALRVGSWTNTQNETTEIDAPSIGVLTAGANGFQPNLVLSGTGSSKPTLTSASITGALGSGYWGIGGNATNVTIGSTGTSWTGSFGALNNLTVRKGGLPSSITATTIGAITINGDLTGSIIGTSARSVRVTGNVSGASLNFSQAVGKTAALGTLTVVGAFTNSTLTSAGSITSIVLGTLTGSSILLDTSATSVSDVTASNIGDAILHSLTIRSKAASAFSDSNVIAEQILTASTGQVNATNGGSAEGLAAEIFKSLTIGADNGYVHLPTADLTSASALSSYLTTKGINFGTFTIDVVPAAATPQ